MAGVRIAPAVACVKPRRSGAVGVLLAARARVLEAGAALAPARRSQTSDEIVERALAAAIAGDPDAPEDVGARELGLVAEPLDDRRRVAHDGRRAPATCGSGRHIIHDRSPEQVRYRNRACRRSTTSEALARIGPISLSPVDKS